MNAVKFKIDENLPIEVADLLRASGHDALTIHDQNMVGDADFQIALICQMEQRALLTLDLDFSDIRAYPPSDHAGIVVLRPQSQGKSTVLDLISKLIPLLQTEPLTGKLWIVQENGLRVRE